MCVGGIGRIYSAYFFVLMRWLVSEILIIDDCQIICNVIAGALDVDGISCTSSNSGIEAMSLISKNNYSTIFLDVNLPDSDSVDIAAFIRKKSLLTQIVVISGDMNDDVFYQFINFGVNDFFHKNMLSITDIGKTVKFGAWRQERLASLFSEIK